MYLWVHIDPASSTCERDLPLQMETHWQCGRLLYLPSSWVWKPDTSFMCVFGFPLKRKLCLRHVSLTIGQCCLALLNSPQKEAYE